MMKCIIFFASLILLISSCNTTNSTKKSMDDYFEGTILFDVTYKSNRPEISSEALKATQGAKLVFSVKDGNTRKDFYSSDGKLLRTSIFYRSENRIYSETMDSDTILTYNANSSYHNTSVKKIKKEKYFGHECDVIEIEGMPKAEFSDYPSIKGTYYTTEKLKLNPLWFSNFLDGGFNEVAKLGKGFYIKNIVEMGIYDKINNVSKIEVQKLNAEIFKPNANKILKEI
jgi:hypothetical protein